MSRFEEPVSQAADILIVDDDPAILRLFTHILEQGGHRIRSVQDGNQALHQILQDCPEILIADWMMPGLDGLELCRRVRQLQQRTVLPHHVYILLLTSRAGKHYFLEGLEAGVDDFLDKSTGNLNDFRIEIRARIKTALRTRRLERDLEFAAKYDSLTRVLKRTTFFEAAQSIWDRSIREKFPLAAVMIDCDYLKRINDIHGHLAGDAVLTEMARFLKSHSRQTDILCRYGGEEFCILLPGCNEETAWNWAERLRKRFESQPIRHEQFGIAITASFGIAERMDDTIYIDQLIERADQSLVAAKEFGRNRCVRYVETIAVDAPDARFESIDALFENTVLADVMQPLTAAVSTNDPVADVADFLLRTQRTSLPVLEPGGQAVGTVADRDLFRALGKLERWSESLDDLFTRGIVTYPAEAPLQLLFDFFRRDPLSSVVVVQDGLPTGTVSRTLLFRWLRNRWVQLSGHPETILPGSGLDAIPADSLNHSIQTLGRDIAELQNILGDENPAAQWEQNRGRLIALISRSQDMMDQLLKFGGKTFVK